jgi:hypothetical protein
MGRRNSLLTAGNGGKLPKSYRTPIEIDFGNAPLLAKSVPNFFSRFGTDPSPSEIFSKTYRNPLQSGLPKPETAGVVPTLKVYNEILI